jgi:drug/metabolite transporter (DMT)-like permease
MLKTPARSLDRRTVLGLLFAFGAAISYGSSQVLTRHSVSDLAPPLVGTLLALIWGTTGFFLITLRSLAERPGDLRRGAVYFVGAGLFSAAGVMFMFQALSRGEVVIVSPVLATNSLFTLVLAAMLLRGVERITARVVLGAALVVAGVVVLTVA